MNNHLKKLANVAKGYRKHIKIAFDANEDRVAVKRIIESFLKKLANEPGGEGIMYVSNVSVQRRVDYVHVAFIANLDVTHYDELLQNKSNRDSSFQNELVPILSKYFGGLPVTLIAGDIYTENPGWFGKKYD